MKILSLFLSKPMWRDLAALFALALLVRLLAALPQQQPNYMDAAYSYVNALNLAQGRGFVEDFVWIYLDNPTPPPHPSHLYWLPLTSILAAAGMMVGGLSYRAAQLPFVVVSALLASITYYVAWVWSHQRRLGWLAGLLAIFSGFYFPFWTAIDNFTPFGVAGALALLLAMNNEPMNNEQLSTHHASRPLTIIIAGICVGLSHLARADGFLLLITIVLIYFFQPWLLASRPNPDKPEPKRMNNLTPRRQDAKAQKIIQNFASLFLCAFAFDSLPQKQGFDYLGTNSPHFMQYPKGTMYVIRNTFVIFFGYLLIMGPWFIRNWLAVGTPFPTAGTQTIWLTNYDELFSYGRELSARTFLAQGLVSALQGRWWVLTTNLQTVFAVWGMIFLLPLALVGGWQLRRQPLLQLAGLYALLLLVTFTLVFAFPGARGGLFHSGAALLPYIDAAAVIGLDRAIAWAAARRRAWDARLAQQVFSVGLVALAVALSGFIYYRQVNAWNNADSQYPAIAAWVLAQNPAAVVMINNPPAYRYHGGGLSVVIPNENAATTWQAAQHYHVNYLILEPNHPAPLTSLYLQTASDPRFSLVKTFGDTYIFAVR